MITCGQGSLAQQPPDLFATGSLGKNDLYFSARETRQPDPHRCCGNALLPGIPAGSTAI